MVLRAYQYRKNTVMENLNPKNLNGWVIAMLCHDENTSDAQMLTYFMEQGNISEEQARAWVAERPYYKSIEHLRDSLGDTEEYQRFIKTEIETEQGRERAGTGAKIVADAHGDWRCLCGNGTSSDGFYPCDSAGNEVEPTPEAWTTNWYVCGRCGRFFDQYTLTIVKRAAVA